MKADGKNQYIKLGDNRDVVQAVVRCYERWRTQPKEIVEDLKDAPIYDACYSIFRHIVDNVRYQEDKAGYQFIKSPARLLQDEVGDCKSMTIFVCSCLYCLGIKHTIRFVNFDGGTQYTHVYALAEDENGQIITIDCVERDGAGKPIFDYARPFKKHKDIFYKEI